MKNIILTAVLVLMVSCKKEGFAKAQHIPSKIDGLEPDGIEQLIRETDTNFCDFELRPYSDYRFLNVRWPDSIVQKTVKRFKIDKTFYKADFDNNGYIDILAMGDFRWCTDSSFCHPGSLVIMNFGKDSIQLSQLSDDIFFPLPVVPQLQSHKDSLPLIILHTFNNDAKHKPVTLIYKHGGFVELTHKKTSHTIEKIQFTAGGCDGNCPIFEITIDAGRMATFYAVTDNFKIYSIEEQYFEATVKQQQFDNIMGVLQYIDFESLDDNYDKGGYGGRPARLTITYDGGKTKTIHDYMLQGSYGLRVLYEHLHKLRFNQNWKEKKNKPKDLNKSFDNLYPPRLNPNKKAAR
jgi:Fe-S cluster biogenesis protein NfuA